MQEFCGNCGSKLEEGVKFCPTCGSPVGENEEIVDVNKHFSEASKKDSSKKDRNTYKLITGIIMIALGSLLLLGGLSDIGGTFLIYIVPGAAGLAGGILDIMSRNDHSKLKTAGILFLVGAGSNFIAILDISIYTIVAVVFGILNLIYSKKQ